MSWREIENHVKSGQTLLYDGLRGKYFLDDIEIFPSQQAWPDNLLFNSHKIEGREIFGTLQIIFREIVWETENLETK